MALDIIFEIFAANPPSILLALGGIGWILCGLTNINVFCDWWGPLIGAGLIFQAIYIIYKVIIG